jgi:hypothetical protein
MNQELTNKLLDKYPKLFSKIKRIYCPDGWFHLLDLSCQLLQGYADRNSQDPTAQVAFTNINQHMGELRMFYVGGRMHDYLDGVKDNAQKLSATICEETGGKGSKHRLFDGTIKTVSDEVAAANNMSPIVPVIAVKDTRSSPVESGPIGDVLALK